MRVFVIDVWQYWRYRQRHAYFEERAKEMDHGIAPHLAFPKWRESRFNPRIRATEDGMKIRRVK